MRFPRCFEGESLENLWVFLINFGGKHTFDRKLSAIFKAYFSQLKSCECNKDFDVDSPKK